MEILSLDILKIAQALCWPWRWLRRRRQRRSQQIFRHNVEGLEIVVTVRQGTVVNSSITADTDQDISEVHGLVDVTYVEIIVQRSA